MKIVIRSAVAHFTLSPAGPRPERTARRSITFSPEGGATVILRARRLSHADAEPAALATA